MPNKTRSDGVLGRLSRVASIKGNQSSLYRWMMTNYDEFASILEGVTRPGWDSIASELSAEGIRKPDGGILTGVYARQVWWKVRTSRKAKPEPKPAPVSPAQIVPNVHRVTEPAKPTTAPALPTVPIDRMGVGGMGERRPMPLPKKFREDRS